MSKYLYPLPPHPRLRVLVEQPLQQPSRPPPKTLPEPQALLRDVGVDLVLAQVGRVSERELAGQHLVHHAPERPPVHRRRMCPL